MRDSIGLRFHEPEDVSLDEVLRVAEQFLEWSMSVCGFESTFLKARMPGKLTEGIFPEDRYLSAGHVPLDVPAV